jgi:hypothetical protein
VGIERPPSFIDAFSVHVFFTRGRSFSADSVRGDTLHYKVCEAVCARAWHSRARASQLIVKMCNGGDQPQDGDMYSCYVALELEIAEFPVVLRPHATVAYSAPFRTWHEVHTFKFACRMLLEAHREVGINWCFTLPNSLASFWVSDSCEGHALLQCMADALPHGIGCEPFGYHVTFTGV